MILSAVVAPLNKSSVDHCPKVRGPKPNAMCDVGVAGPPLTSLQLYPPAAGCIGFPEYKKKIFMINKLI